MIKFELNEKEFKRYKAFYNKKIREWKKKDPERMVTFSFIFSPTGIGDKVVIRCNQDEDEKDISDYDSW